MEQWRPVVGYEGLYEVSDLGRIRSETRLFTRKHGVKFTLTGRVLVQTHDSRGYPKVELWKDGKQRTKKIHIAVAEAFIGPRVGRLEVCHEDGKPANCAASNLRYDTKRGNMADKVKHGTAPWGERCGTSKLNAEQVAEIRRRTEPSEAIAPEYGVCGRHIRALRRRENWQHV